VEPIGLRRILHHQQTTVLERDGDCLLGSFVLEAKFSFRSEADRGNGSVPAQRLLVIAVPGHTLVSVMVEVEQTGIELRCSAPLYDRFQSVQFGSPKQCSFRCPGISVGIGVVAIPGYFPGGDDVFAEDDRFIVLPRDAME